MPPATESARRFLPPVVVVVAGVLLSVFLILRNLEVENARASFDSVARERLDALETNIVLTVNNLISVDAFFDASQRFDRAGFARFAAVLTPESQGRQIEWNIGDLPYVECDSGLMKQVFQNLLSNAVKFTRPRLRAVIEVGQQQQSGNPVIYVRDNGVGFGMKNVEKLFGVFQRLHSAEDFEGTGVGLAIVQRIIVRHGGRIWVDAELEKGATFYFTLGTSEKIDGAKS